MELVPLGLEKVGVGSARKEEGALREPLLSFSNPLLYNVVLVKGVDQFRSAADNRSDR